MCIFFLPPKCHFGSAGTNQSNDDTKYAFYTITRDAVDDRFTDPSRTRIGLCVCPTDDNPFFCTNLQARHRSSKVNPGASFEVCRSCTVIGKRWQKALLERLAESAKWKTMSEREQLDADWALKGESMLNRKRSQEVKKTPCLCEKAMAGFKVEGDRLCGGPEMVLEIRPCSKNEVVHVPEV